MTAVELGKKIRSKEIGVAEAIKSTLKTISASETNAFITVADQEKLITRAEEIQKRINSGELASPLTGVPIGIKDNICTKDMRTTCASKILDNFIPPYNATVVTKLEQAGAIVVGKLNMDEFGMGSTSETSYYGAVKNPWDKSRVSGGSSGGSAAAVAADEIFCSLGTDTGGSIRQPASYCGVTGFKPTYGTVSRNGLIAYASSLDQIGPIAKDVEDCAALMNIIAGKDPLDGTSLDTEKINLTRDIKGKKIALPQECFSDGVDEDVKRQVLASAEVFKALGAEVEYINLSFNDYVIPAYYIIATAEASSNLSRFDGAKYGFRAEGVNDLTQMYNATRSQGFGSEVIKRILLGTFVLSSGFYDAYYRKALQVKSIIKTHFDNIFEKYDAILCPVSPITAPLIGDSADSLKNYLMDIFTVAVNLAGLSGLSVPCGLGDNGMPVGAQIIGNRDVLSLGYAFQKATDFHRESVIK